MIERAKSAVGHKTVYKLGMGGMKPGRERPGNSEGQSDCSGFFAWYLGISRQDARIDGGWIETSAIVRDATGPQKRFKKLDKPVVGCGVVYGDANGRQGHVGVVVEVKHGVATRVIHCSMGNYRDFGDAIRETPAVLFTRNPRTIYVEFIA